MNKIIYNYNTASLFKSRFADLTKASRPLRNLMRECLKAMGLAVEDGPADLVTDTPGGKKRGRCGVCHWKENKKGTAKCAQCSNFICKEHKVVKVLCKSCDV